MRRSIPGHAVRAAAVTMAACATLTLAACGGGNPLSGGGGGGDLKPEDSPLSKWYESFSADQELSEQEAQDQQMQAEEAIAACMQKEGFEYIPVDYSRDIAVSGGDDGGPEYGTKEWAAQNGYQAFVMGGEPTDGDEEGPVDPNQAYIESLSESSRTAFETALYGDQSGIDWEDPDFDPSSLTPEQRGCSGKAWDEVGATSPGQNVWDSEEGKAFSEETNSLWEEISKATGMGKANAAWADCMADAGFADRNWTTPADPEKAFQDEANAAWEKAGEGFDYENATEDTEYPDPTTTDEWKKKAEEEKDTAVADYTCRESTGWEQARLKIQFDLEQEFIDSHREQMDKIVAMYEESTK